MSTEQMNDVDPQQIFSELKSRVHFIKEGLTDHFNDGFRPEFIINRLLKSVYRIPPSSAIQMVNVIIVKLTEVETDLVANGNEEFPSIYILEIKYYLNQLQKISNELQFEVVKSGAGKDVNQMGRSEPIKTNLTVDELAILFKILHEYDVGNSREKKVLGDYRVKRDLFRAVINTFRVSGSDQVTLGSFESKYGSSDQSKAVEFWIKKFTSLRIVASNLQRELERRPDIVVKKSKTK